MIRSGRAFLLPLALAMPACGGGGDSAEEAPVDAAAKAEPLGPLPGKPGEVGHGGWIRLRGTVVSALPKSFVLDYGPGNITVEMDDWKRYYPDGAMLRSGDHVVVAGRIDDDLYLRKRIEAASVFVEELNTQFFASPADEENAPAPSPRDVPQASYVDMVGEVADVEGRSFTLRTGGQAIPVDTSAMSDDPFDEEGRYRAEEGGRVYVWGDLELGTRETTKLNARGMISVRSDGR